MMKEIGIDLSNATPTKLTEDVARGASLLVTMGCGEQCPYIPGLRVEDWPLPDPRGKPPKEVRAIRDNIKSRVEGLLQRI